jgi:hypothetical protein
LAEDWGMESRGGYALNHSHTTLVQLMASPDPLQFLSLHYMMTCFPLCMIRSFDQHGIIRDIVQSHLMQTIALFAMEPPVSLDGEDIRNEKVLIFVLLIIVCK